MMLWFNKRRRSEALADQAKHGAITDYLERANEALRAFVPDDPAYRIGHAPAGYFYIQKREVLLPVNAWPSRRMAMLTRDPEEIAGYSAEPFVDYRTIDDSFARFTTFEDAEAYLKRMLDPSDGVVAEYDYPPLKRREGVGSE